MSAPSPKSHTAAPAPAELRAPAWQMLEHSLAATSLCDLDGRILYVNPAFLSLWGFDDAQAVVGQIGMEILWADPPQAAAAKSAVLARGAWAGMIAGRRPDGLTVQVWCSAHLVSDAEGLPIALMSSFVDRSAEIEARISLERQSEFLEAVIGSGSVLVAVLDQGGRFIRFNEACERVSGRLADEVIGQPYWTTVLPPECDAEIEARNFAAAMASGQPGELSHCQSTWMSTDGTRRLIEWSNSLLTRGDESFLVSKGIDITERDAAQRALLTSQRRLQRAQQVTHTGVWELDIATGHLDWSEEVYRIFELDPSRQIGTYQAFVDAVHPHDRASVHRAYADSIDSGQPYSIEHRLQMPDGRIKWVEERCETEFGPDGRPVRSLGTVQDVTVRHDRANDLRRFQHMVESASQEIWLIDARNSVRFVNEAAARSLGRARADLVGRSMAEIDIDCEGLDSGAACSTQRRRPSGTPQHTFEVEHLHRDGHAVPKEIRTAAVEIDGESFCCAYAHDISERRRMQAALVASEAMLRTTLDTYPGWVACVDDDLRYVYVNPNLAQSLGLEQEQIVGHTVEAVRGSAVAQELRSINARLLAGEAVQLERRQTLGGTERRFWVHYRVARDPRHPGRHVFYGFGTDLDELRRTQLRLQAIVEGTHIGTWEWNADSGHIEVNDELPMLAGWSRGELPGDAATWLTAQVHPDDAGLRRAMFRRVLRREALTIDGEYRVRHRDGHWIWVLERGRVISFSDAGAPLLLIGAIQDVTALKQAAEELRRLNDELEGRVAERTRELEAAKSQAEHASLAKTEFLSRMSHELRTPLNAIIGFGQLLELAALPDSEAEHVREIRRAGLHLLDLINEVLDLAAVESGHVNLLLQPLALPPIIDECLRLIRPAAARQGIELYLDGVDVGAPVLADRGRLKQVLLNLLSNAVKYNRLGGQVHLACRLIEPAGCEILVRDTGQGLDESQIGRLFKPFERLEARHGSVEGTGIGLTVSKRLMELMGGAIGVTSRLGEGSTFWLRLPLAQSARISAPPLLPAVAAVPTLAAAAAPARHKILYIEDNAANLRLMERIVALQSDLVLVALADPRQAVSRVQAECPALVMLDIQLPYMDGFELFARLREAGIDVPVIAVSANAMAADIQRAVEAGFSAYLTKPLDIRSVLETLAMHVPAAPPAH